jgi:hypothetical protein
MLALGDTVLLPKPGQDKPHLWVLVTAVSPQTGDAIIVNFTTERPHSDNEGTHLFASFACLAVFDLRRFVPLPRSPRIQRLIRLICVDLCSSVVKSPRPFRIQRLARPVLTGQCVKFTHSGGDAQATLKPPRSHIYATFKPPTSQAVGTRKPPSSHPQATLKLPSSYPGGRG